MRGSVREMLEIANAVTDSVSGLLNFFGIT